MNALPPELTPAKLVEEYIALRDDKKRADEMYAAWQKENYTLPMKDIEAQLLDMLNKLGADNISTPSGTAYKKLSTSVTVADMREFRRHVIGTEEWGLADWRANKTTIDEMVENGEPLPPGLNRTAFYSIGIRRS